MTGIFSHDHTRLASGKCDWRRWR